jgi:hypothetical protein
MTMRSGRSITVLAIAAGAVVLTACTTTVSGTAMQGGGQVRRDGSSSAPVESSSSEPSSTAGAGVSFDLCSLLESRDLPYYHKAQSSFGPTNEKAKGYQQSCSWTGSVGASKGVTQLLFSLRPTVKVKQPTGTFAVGGKRVQIGELSDGEGRERKVTGCVCVLDFAGGRLGIAIDDADAVFGTPCDQVKHVARLVAKREPR